MQNEHISGHLYRVHIQTHSLHDFVCFSPITFFIFYFDGYFNEVHKISLHCKSNVQNILMSHKILLSYIRYVFDWIRIHNIFETKTFQIWISNLMFLDFPLKTSYYRCRHSHQLRDSSVVKYLCKIIEVWYAMVFDILTFQMINLICGLKFRTKRK